jgi:hypothetical protein
MVLTLLNLPLVKLESILRNRTFVAVVSIFDGPCKASEVLAQALARGLGSPAAFDTVLDLQISQLCIGLIVHF